MLNLSPGATYGWRARIGFVTPTPVAENNPYEFYLMAPEGVTIVLTSLGVLDLTQEQYDRALGRLESAAGEVVNRKVDAIVQAGVPLVVTHGWGFEREVLARIARVTAVPAATDIGSCIRAMRALEMSRVVMLTPFEDEMHTHLADYVKNAGIEVVAAHSIRASVPFEDVSTVPLAVPYRAAKALYRSAEGADGIWITGALMPSVGAIDPLEADLGAPVVSSMQAMTWAGLHLTGISTENVVGYGRLFQAEWEGVPAD